MLVKHAALEHRYHILDVYKGIFPTGSLKQLKGFLDQLSQILPLSLAVINVASLVQVLLLEDVENRQNLPVVRHQGFTDHFPTGDQLL